MEEGLTEEEISRKLTSPKEVAKEYQQKNIEVNKFEKGVKTTGVVFMSIPLSLIYVLMWASVLVLGVFSLVCVVTGFCLITTINIAGLIPHIPYFSSLLAGISLFGLSALSAIGTIYLFLYIKQWGKVYLRFCKNIINNNHYPTISKHPKVSKKISTKFKLIAFIGLALFLSTFVIAYISMCIASNSFEPWHVWNWFV